MESGKPKNDMMSNILNNNCLIPVESDIGNSCPSGSHSTLYRDKFSKLAIKVPDKPREFTEGEINLIKRLPYKNTFVGIRNPKKRDRQSDETISHRLNQFLLTITIIEINGAYSTGGCELAEEQLGIVFNSKSHAENILDTLLDCGIIQIVGKKHSYEDYQARHYKFTDKFINAECFYQLNKKFNKQTI